MSKSCRSVREVQGVNSSVTGDKMDEHRTNKDGGEYVIYYKGMESRHHFGADFAIHKDYEARVIEFKPISERLSSIRTKKTYIDLFIINIRFLIENSEEDVKEFFYDKLTRIYNNAPGNTIKIIIEDANAKIGKETYYVPTIGLESTHDLSNDNGVRLISFARSRNMVISSTTFPHKNIYINELGKRQMDERQTK